MITYTPFASEFPKKNRKKSEKNLLLTNFQRLVRKLRTNFFWYSESNVDKIRYEQEEVTILKNFPIKFVLDSLWIFIIHE